MIDLSLLSEVLWLKDFTWAQDPTIVRVILAIAIWLGLILLPYLLMKSVNYRLTESHLVITLMGIPVRRVRIRDIRHMDTDAHGVAERWYNTLSSSRARLVIHRKKGWPFRTIIITPKNPFGMMHDLQKAKEKNKATEGAIRS